MPYADPRLKRLAIVLLGIILLATAFSKSAKGHDWYPPHCCKGAEHGGDCRPVEADSLVQVAPNNVGMPCWKYLPTGNLFCGSQIHPSQDRHWHVCIGNGSLRDEGGRSDLGTSYCAFIQMGF